MCHNCRVVLDTTRKTIELYCDGKLFPLPDVVRSRLHEALQRKWQGAEEKEPQATEEKAANSNTKYSVSHKSNENRRLLKLVNEAEKRQKKGGCGLGVPCHEEVEQKRLEAGRGARHCIECQTKQD